MRIYNKSALLPRIGVFGVFLVATGNALWLYYFTGNQARLEKENVMDNSIPEYFGCSSWPDLALAVLAFGCLFGSLFFI
jgi:hypothetical protein